MKIALLLLSIGGALVTGVPSTKKGVCMSPAGYTCTDPEQFNNLAWYYDWSMKPVHEKIYCTNTLPGSERVPMKKSMQWAYMTIPSGSKYLLGFNEVNHKTQANMKPQEAAYYWARLEKAAKKANVIGLVSPSAAYCGGGPTKCITTTAIEWYDAFFQICSNCRIDHIATHHFSCDPDETMAYLAELYEKYTKPIWLTEFACPSSDYTTVAAYMNGVLPLLEEAPYVFRYAWYSTRNTNPNLYIPPINSLLEEGGTGLTTLGQIYDSYQP
ncbi:unnamed protein product [Owenia fusiformis]|uniref:Asl1-like glycosyl hydrolase catalytic domain-containing protein n=1 Tax=Owenia fusiformis TaxID=6347 RepID=A0A8S4Q1C9_OWEFU|nr:unnamed protein product [Owenia fusiformis]